MKKALFDRHSALAYLLLCVSIAAPSVEADGQLEDWTRSFYSLYSSFDGSHLAHYADKAVLIDVFLGLELKAKSEIESAYRAAADHYENVEFQLDAVAVQSTPSASNDARAHLPGGTTVVRGRVAGLIDGAPFSLPFVTWIELERGLITRQWDYVDYSSLASRMAASSAAP
ncbi:MAG: hypothetical protein AAFY29_18120 [Pseudomonadota bacterium]